MSKRSSDSGNTPTKKSKKAKPCDDDKQAGLLGAMLGYHMREDGGITFQKLSKDLDFHKGNKAWAAVWKAAKEDKSIEEVSTGKGFTISEKGIGLASTPEFEEWLKDKSFVPQTNEEHQANLRKRMNPMGLKIFDLLLKHGSLSRHALAGLLHTKPGSKGYFYAEQELRKKGIVEFDPADKKKKRLSKDAFLSPDDRPEPMELDADVLAKAETYATSKNKDSTSAKAKKEGSAKAQKPPNAFQLFSRKNRASVLEEYPDIEVAKKKLRKMWKALSAEEKEEYNVAPSDADKEKKEETEGSTKNETNEKDNDEPIKEKEGGPFGGFDGTVKKEDSEEETPAVVVSSDTVKFEELVDSTKKETIQSEAGKTPEKKVKSKGKDIDKSFKSEGEKFGNFDDTAKEDSAETATFLAKLETDVKEHTKTS